MHGSRRGLSTCLLMSTVGGWQGHAALLTPSIVLPAGAVGHGGHYHSQSPESFFTHIPGIKVWRRLPLPAGRSKQQQRTAAASNKVALEGLCSPCQAVLRLQVVMPSGPREAKGALVTAAADVHGWRMPRKPPVALHPWSVLACPADIRQPGC